MVLVLNCGSQSIKWKIFNIPSGRQSVNLKVLKEGRREILNSSDFEKILEEEIGKLRDFEINIIGHRVVHGGQKFFTPLKISSDAVIELETLNNLAPLHNPYNILGIKICAKFFNTVPQYAVFDTEFFQTLPEKAFMYALPETINNEFGLRRYGFQGISHEFAAKTAASLIKKPFNKLKIITCHLGGGASVTAIKNGRAIDTSMGFTPMEGLVMMTRSGSIDPGIILLIAEKLGIEKTKEILNKKSGIKGISGAGNMLELLELIKTSDEKAKLAFDIFIYSIQKQIGAYYVALGGCDILVFTGAIGSGISKTRDSIVKGLDILLKNTPLSKRVKVTAIEADEEKVIAQKILKL